MPKDCNGLELIDKTADFCKINCKWVKKVRGRHAKEKKTAPLKKKKAGLKHPKVICLVLEKAHLDYIKGQALKRSLDQGFCVEPNEIIREALAKAFPCPEVFDMFGEKKNEK